MRSTLKGPEASDISVLKMNALPNLPQLDRKTEGEKRK
jgi:hypothetical protein